MTAKQTLENSALKPATLYSQALGTISNMKIRLLIGLTIALSSCVARQTDQTSPIGHVEDSTDTGLNADEFEGQEDCHLWLSDSDTTLSTGNFVKYIIEDNRVKIQWGNNHFKRTLENDYDCQGAPSWVPTIRWSTSKYIGLKYGCGSPCWGSIILPTNGKDPVIERMYDLEIDTLTNRMVYLDNETYDKLLVENLQTGEKISIDYEFDCKAAFVGFCIDTIGFDNDKLFVKWVDWTDDEKEKKIKTEEFNLGL